MAKTISDIGTYTAAVVHPIPYMVRFVHDFRIAHMYICANCRVCGYDNAIINKRYICTYSDSFNDAIHNINIFFFVRDSGDSLYTE